MKKTLFILSIIGCSISNIAFANNASEPYIETKKEITSENENSTITFMRKDFQNNFESFKKSLGFSFSDEKMDCVSHSLLSNYINTQKIKIENNESNRYGVKKENLNDKEYKKIVSFLEQSAKIESDIFDKCKTTGVKK